MRAWSSHLLLVAVMAAAAAGCASPGQLRSRALTRPSFPETRVLYVARRGWHIDVGFAVDDLQEPLQRVSRYFSGARFLFIGFGDRAYLESTHADNRPTSTSMLKALVPGAGLLLVTGLSATPDAAFGQTQMVEMRVTRDELDTAQSLVFAAFSASRLPAGQHSVAPVHSPGPYEGSLYFDAAERYSALHTCNTWVAEVLRDAGQPVRSVGTVFAWQLWNQTALMNARASLPAAPLPMD